MLALELVAKTTKNVDLKIVCSTHSRYILEALDVSANVVHFQNGELFDDVRHSSILLDIGAADADYLFQKKTLKYIVATEDKVDNIVEKKEFIRKFVLANGVAEDEFVLHSYEGCTKVDFAKILEGFVRKHIPAVEVILHIDRDQKVDSDRELIKLRQDCEKRSIKLFVTDQQEIESYFCKPEHICQVYSISLNAAQQAYDIFVDELKPEAIRKLSNFILRERPELALNKSDKPDITALNELVDKWYVADKYQFTPGKELLGKIKNFAQANLGLDPNSILEISTGLNSESFQLVLNKKF